MLGYKDGQGIQPSYNYYLETDLDNVDDQLVDYSKRYADQDSDDVCCSTSGKKRHHSPSIANSVTKQSYDEVKVYCMEGTPLMISSASSLCDLREVDITEQGPEVIISKTGKKHCFSQSPRCSTVDQEISENKSIEIVSSSELLSVQCEKEESRKEGNENVLLICTNSIPMIAKINYMPKINQNDFTTFSKQFLAQTKIFEIPPITWS